MTSHRRPGRRLGALVAGLLPAVLLAACITTTDLDRSTPAASQPAPSPTTVAVAAATASPAPTPEVAIAPPSPSPTPKPQPTPSESPGVVGLPDSTDQPDRGGDGTSSLLGRGGRVEVPGYGVVLTLPKGWRTLNVRGEDLAAVLEALPRRAIDPATAAWLVDVLDDRVRLLAFDLQRANRGASFNVTTFDRPIPSFLLRSTAELALAAVPGVRDPRFQDLTIDGSPALRADFALTLGEGRQRTTYHATQVFLPTADATVLLTVAIPRGGQTEDAERIVRSLGLD